MRITVVCVGKIKEKFYTQAVDEYSKRLSRYCKLDIVELPDEKTQIMRVMLLMSRLRIRKGRESFLQLKMMLMYVHLQ